MAGTWRIGLASPRVAPTRAEGVAAIGQARAEAAAQGVALVCFPETFLPGYRRSDFPTPPPDQDAQERALQAVCDLARRHQVAAIVPMEWASPAGLLNLAFVVNADGTVQGSQTKNQLAPEEESQYAPGDRRRLFVVDDVPFGVVICHEGWRYPETVRWAARHGARVVFHPHLSGSDRTEATPRRSVEPTAPYFEQTMIVRAVENAVSFASVHFALRYPETATSLIAPDGRCVARLAYGASRLLVGELELAAATGSYAQRYAPERYRE